jgi:hypothetical protein
MLPNSTTRSKGVLKIKRRRMKLAQGENRVIRVDEKTNKTFPAPTEDGVWCEKVKKWFYKVDAAQLLANF